MSKELIDGGDAVLGIELGSTRIKLALVGSDPNQVLGTGVYEWENQLVDGLWTYSLDSVWEGLQQAFADLQNNLETQYGTTLSKPKAIGVSAMMHGYLAFDDQDQLLIPFRTWRNTNTQKAATELSELFGVNIPLRWSIAHLHQLVLENAEHVPNITFMTTLAGYVHWRLTGQKVLGIGDASGMFPIDSATKNYDARMLGSYNELATSLALPLESLLPEVLLAGADAGTLSAEGAKLLDPSGRLLPGVMLCPAEGDAGSGMVATNAVLPTTGNVSAGTSIFAMVVMEKPLTQVHHELDIVTTPAGDPVAMVHCNNGASELAAWAGMFKQFSDLAGSNLSTDQVFEVLFKAALSGEPDAGGLLAYNYLAGEPIAGLEAGRPVFVRTPDSDFSLANAFRAQLFGVFGTLAIGMKVLAEEGVRLSRMSAHGGIFRTAGVAQSFLAAALNAPVSVSSGASEGGAWGMALLASFAASESKSLGEFLEQRVFSAEDLSSVEAQPSDIAGFERYLKAYRAGLKVVSAAAEVV